MVGRHCFFAPDYVFIITFVLKRRMAVSPWCRAPSLWPLGSSSLYRVASTSCELNVSHKLFGCLRLGDGDEGELKDPGASHEWRSFPWECPPAGRLAHLGAQRHLRRQKAGIGITCEGSVVLMTCTNIYVCIGMRANVKLGY